MISKAITRVFGSKHDRDLKRLQPLVDAINALEPELESLSDDQLRARTSEARTRLDQGADLDDLLVPAFATVREASRRTLGMRHYDVQLLGGIVLHQGKIAEMKTGEGKTLVATLPVYLNALAGQGAHVVTVNDYLARRDAEWMGQIYRFLGLDVGVVQHGLTDQERQQAYGADITYGTNNELGFDYLRDNMKFTLESMVQRGHHFAIVDEVDSILIDEARTPLIISGPSEQSTEKYTLVNRIIPKLERGEELRDGDRKYTTGDFVCDEKTHTANLTDEGAAKVEKLLGIGNLYEMENMDVLHAVNQGLRAHHLYRRDVEYLMENGQVVIVDEFTGRKMPGRRWSDGLHQAVEAKEGVRIERENQTLATITFQNYFRMYEKLAGMTGTADTEAGEFSQIYDLDVVVVPTNEPMIRDDRSDLVYRTAPEKWNAVVKEIQDCQKHGQPVLVGTISIENSEMLSRLLKRNRVQHVVLNAKYHEREASIVAQAGRRGAVTIATNMAGRGTDIVLGGNPEQMAQAEVDRDKDPEGFAQALERHKKLCAAEREEVVAAGGVHILGTERHESRRIDNQLRGRSGRQGDPGSSRFYLSLQDDLMRIFASDRVQALMKRLGMEEGVPIEAGMVNRAIERAQTQVEGRNFEIRKNLLEYDDVMNKQREAIYELRRDILLGREGRDYVMKIASDVVDYLIERHCPAKLDPRDWKLEEMRSEIRTFFDLEEADLGAPLDELGTEELQDAILSAAERSYSEKEETHGADALRAAERHHMLRVVDTAWKDHLLALDHLKEGIGLRGYGQRDPKNEYKRESYELFTEMKERTEDTIIKDLFRLRPVSAEEIAELERRRRAIGPQGMSFRHPSALGLPAAPAGTQPGAGPGMPGMPGMPGAGPSGPAPAGFPPPQGPTGPPMRPQKPRTVVRPQAKVGRNAPCPCGSGKKYKKCHGAPVAV